jgi:hypothetical protein
MVTDHCRGAPGRGDVSRSPGDVRGKQIRANKRKVGDELAGLAIAEDESEEGAKILDGYQGNG